jgi:hypothetical protein
MVEERAIKKDVALKKKAERERRSDWEREPMKRAKKGKQRKQKRNGQRGEGKFLKGRERSF